MQDLLTTHKTLCAGLADKAVVARFELAQAVAEPEKYEELPRLNEFLQSAAAARIKYPTRMRNLDERYMALKHHMLMRTEGELFDILPKKNRISQYADVQKTMNDNLKNLGRTLYELAATLYKIDEEYARKLLEYEDSNGV